MSSFIWFIDSEWDDYTVEERLIRESLLGHEIRYSSKKSYLDDLNNFGWQAEALVVQIDIPISETLINQLEKCKIIAVYGAGYDNIDVKAAAKANIIVANVPGFCAHEVSDHIIAYIYHFNRGVSTYRDKIKNGLWGIDAVEKMPKRLYGSSVFIVGFGHIGRILTRKLQGLGVKITSFDPFLTEDEMKALGAEKVSWTNGLQTADFIVITSQLTPETRGMINEKTFQMMKPESFLINTSRGELVVEDDLINAVREHRIAGAALDVTTAEPLPVDSPLLSCENILITPHISYLSQDSLQELREKCIGNVIDMFEKGKPTYEVCYRETP